MSDRPPSDDTERSPTEPAWQPPDQRAWQPPDQPAWQPPAHTGWQPPDQPAASGWQSPQQPAQGGSQSPQQPGPGGWQAPPNPPGQPGWQPPQHPQPGWQPPQHPQPGWQQPSRGGGKGGVILVAVLVAVLVIAIGALFVIIGNGLGQFGDRTPITEVDVGDCFDGMTAATTDGDQVSSQLALVIGVVLVDCAQPHDAELIARFGWTGAVDAYPGLSAVETYSLGECRRHFAEYIGVAYESSRLEMTYTYPLEPQWATGQRSFECIVMGPAADGKLVGSVRGSRR